MHHFVHFAAIDLQGGAVGGGKLRRGQGNGGGVYRLPVNPHFVVQMRAGGMPCAAYQADDCARVHARAHVHAADKRAQMPIQRFHAVVVGEHHGVAVAAFPAAKADHAIAGGEHARALRGGIVNARVHPHGVGDGMHANAKGRGDAGVAFNRQPTKALAQRFAVFVIIIAAVVGIAVFKIIGVVGAVVGGYFGGEHVARCHFLPAKIQAFIQHAHAGTFGQFV